MSATTAKRAPAGSAPSPRADKLRALQIELALKKQELTLAQPLFKEMLDHVADDIRTACAAAANEATLASTVELKLYGLIKDAFGRELLPEREVSVATIRHVAKGRIDSRIGALVVEYKRPSTLSTAAAQASALAQLRMYLCSLPTRPGQLLTGMLTDGTKAELLVVENGTVTSHEPMAPLNGAHLEHFVRNALALDRTALSPENLVRDFCASNNAVATQLAKALYVTITRAPTPRSEMLLQEWQSLFRLAHDDVSKQQPILERKKALGEALGVVIAAADNDTEYRALFALQTSFAIIVKIVALKVISAVRPGSADVSFRAMGSANADALQAKLMRLEEGDIFRELGFGNLLEGDFFAWYSTPLQWSAEVAQAVKPVFDVLARYEDQPLFQGADGAQDFLKDLYMRIIPDKVRHSLGEFYTPPWLADHVVKRALKRVAARSALSFLDPCCGSGTFVTAFLRQSIRRAKGLGRHDQLSQVLRSVKGIDLNPLAVLTARINYFINISSLIGDEDEFEIPIYLGDASYVPTQVTRGGISYVTYELKTLHGPLSVALPASALRDIHAFSKAMTSLEAHIRNRDEDAIVGELWALSADLDAAHETEVRAELHRLAVNLVDLERCEWNGIWARILKNFLTTANLGRFDVIAGNPPWVDWKNLPQGYRERIKGLCLERSLFSGDAMVGGINLNICALITNVAADNWLASNGVLAFLMPEPLLFQQSYEGFRLLKMKDGRRLYFQHIDNWNRAGDPFAPVTQKFLTYVVSAKKQNYVKGIPVHNVVKKPRNRKAGVGVLRDYSRVTDFSSVSRIFDVEESRAVTASRLRTAFSYAEEGASENFVHVAGKTDYRGRQGCEMYPQELFLLEPTGKRAPKDKVHVVNVQMDRSKHRIAAQERLVESRLLHPLVRGTDIERFRLRPSSLVVPFPYDKGARSPMDRRRLAKESPLLLKYLQSHKAVIDAQTTYNQRIIGSKHSTEFYAVARVGEYSYADHFVVFRDNTSWGATVVSSLKTPWSGSVRPVFQKHAGTISQRPDGSFITEDEAHYLCAVLNAPVVHAYIDSTSDSRSFKLQPPINIPAYNARNARHRKLRDLSRLAHASVDDAVAMKKIDEALDETYLAILGAV